MTPEQIKARLKALRDYEMSLYRNTWDDDPDRITEELMKILDTKSKLQAALDEPRNGFKPSAH
jgi:hypothetical protein